MEDEMTEYAWAAVLDGAIQDADLCATREEAEADARWIRNHPACRDRVLFGNGGRVEVMQVAECEWTGELVRVDKAGRDELPFGVDRPECLTEPFCACGHVISRCDGSRVACAIRS